MDLQLFSKYDTISLTIQNLNNISKDTAIISETH